MSNDEMEQTEEFAVELEGRTSVIHRTNCVEMNHVLETGNNPNWIYPFSTYQEAFEYGKNLEGRSYPKTCGKCTPWKSLSAQQTASHEFKLQNVSLQGVYTGSRSWLHAIGAQLVHEQEPTYLNAFYTPNRSNAYTTSKYPLIINLSETQDQVNVKIELSYSIDSEHLFGSIDTYVSSFFSKLSEDLENYLTEVEIDVDTDTSSLYLVRQAFDNLRARRKPLTSGSWDREVQEEPEASNRNLVILLSLGLVLIYGTFFFQFTDQFTENIIELIFTYGAAAGFIYWIYLSDKNEREPIAYIILMFCWGIFAGLIAAPLNSRLGEYFGSATSLLAPFTEEPVKALGLYVFLTQKRFRGEFNSPVDGIVYGLAVGMGFYASENFVYYLNYSVETLIIRILFCWGHGLWVAIVGLWIAVARHQRGYNQPQDLIPGLLVAMFLHLMWNGLSYIGLMTGRILIYFAVWQLNYLRRMIREGRSDEMLRSDVDNIVFNTLNTEGANKHSRSNLLLVVLLFMVIVSLPFYSSRAIRGHSEIWTMMDFMGFSFEYPEKMDVDYHGVNESEPDAFFGTIVLSWSQFGQEEVIVIHYVKTTDSESWKTEYNELIAGEDIERSNEGIFHHNGHEILYRNCTTWMNGDEIDSVTSAWYCLDSHRVFYVLNYATDKDTFSPWKRFITSFTCH